MSVEQRDAALKRANETRCARSAVRWQIRAGELSVIEALSRPCCATATLYSLLAAQWRWGDRKTIAFFSSLANRWQTPISATRRVEDLTEREVDVLRRALERAA